jgi:phage head maturation protease
MATFNDPYKIDNDIEGRFVEIVAPGSFLRTFAEDRDQMRVQLEHGFDFSLGGKPIAVPTVLREDEIGPYYEAELLDGVPELVTDGIRKGQYGASFRFRVMRESWEDEPTRTDWNPDALPVRTIREVQVREFGPVVWGANPAATSGLRAIAERTVNR